jgi:DNA-binding IclR family transcriptional regulator
MLRHDGAVAGVISVCGPIERFRGEVEACAGHLLDVTGSLSVQLGHQA